MDNHYSHFFVHNEELASCKGRVTGCPVGISYCRPASVPYFCETPALHFLLRYEPIMQWSYCQTHSLYSPSRIIITTEGITQEHKGQHVISTLHKKFYDTAKKIICYYLGQRYIKVNNLIDSRYFAILPVQEILDRFIFSHQAQMAREASS